MLWVLPVSAALLPLLLGADWKAWLWWAALMAPCAGALSACSVQWRSRLGGVLVWCVIWILFCNARRLDEGNVLAGFGVLVGLLSLGWILGLIGLRSGRGHGAFSGALLALGLSLLLIGAPAGFWLFSDPPWSPAVAARLLDFSPAALLMEAAGVDFLRLPAIYGPVGADSMDPNLRLAWGNLAGWGGGVLGLCLSLAELVRHRRKLVPNRNS